jgi:hypothetical protein
MIGWKSDNVTVGPVAAKAKQSLIRLIPHIMPVDSDQQSLYRLVLDHGDFGIHNMSITRDAKGQPLVTSLYDWETGCIVQAILSDPLMTVAVDLVTDETAAPSITRVPDDATADGHVQYVTWARQYFKVRPPVTSRSCWRSSPELSRLSLHRSYSSKRPTMNVQSNQEKTHATFGLRCGSGEVKIQRDISANWARGLRRE